MRKIMALILTVIMVCGMIMTVSALDDTVKVATDVQVKANSALSYVQGTVTATKSNNGRDFDFRAVLHMDAVKEKLQASKLLALMKVSEEEYKDLDVKGSFVISVMYPAELTMPEDDAIVLTADSDIFTWDAPERIIIGGAPVIRLNVSVKPGVKAADLEDMSDTMVLLCEGVEAMEVGTYPVVGAMTGSTDIFKGPSKVLTVDYEAEDSVEDGDLTATVIIKKKSSSGGGGSVTTKDVTVKFNVGSGVEGAIPSVTDKDKVVINVNDIDMSKVKKDGYVFAGWYKDSKFTEKVTGEVELTSGTTLYAKWVKGEAPEVLNKKGDHEAYIIGYPDGSVRPNGSLTREEVAEIFYRLLTDETIAEIETTKNSFSDVEADRWSNTAVSTMAKGGYVVGYEDGTFRPTKEITRAEFVTIVAKFLDTELETEASAFTDAKNHWAEQYINVALAENLISGYTDDTFKPDEAITRAEAITIINKLLVRNVEEGCVLDGTVEFTDLEKSDWYYYQILEATNAHKFSREEGEYLEKWTELKDLDIRNITD